MRGVIKEKPVRENHWSSFAEVAGEERVAPNLLERQKCRNAKFCAMT